jgi:heme/copper-type cytochrome/quinol oxidase subunit 3
MAQLTVTQPMHGHLSKEQIATNERRKFAMWLYLASEVVIFSVLIGAYAIFRLTNPENVKAVHDSLGIALVTANTFLLLTSSYFMVMALRAIEMGRRDQFLLWMAGVVVGGAIFLVGQWVEYRELAHLEITLAGISDEFGGFGMRFYTPTAFHGAHVLVGVLLGAWLWVTGARGQLDDNPIWVEVFGLYWHFVDVVWIVLFTLIYLV